MTAAAGRVFGPKPYSDHNALPWGLLYPLAANVAPFRNWFLGFNAAGNMVAMAAGTTGLVSAGFADRDQTSSTLAGEAKMLVRQQFVSGFPNSTAVGDAILVSDIAIPAWAVDNQTVGKLSNQGGSNRSLLGLAFGLDPDSDTPILYTGPIAWLLARASLVADAKDFAWLDYREALAADTLAEVVIPSEKLHGTITAVQFTGAAIAADAVDFITVTIAKRVLADAYAAPTTIATYDSRAVNNGAVTAFTPANFTLSAVAGALNALETDVYTITVAKGGAGKLISGAFRVIGKVS